MKLNTLRFDFDIRLDHALFKGCMDKFNKFKETHNIIHISNRYFVNDDWYYVYVIYEEG